MQLNKRFSFTFSLILLFKYLPTETGNVDSRVEIRFLRKVVLSKFEPSGIISKVTLRMRKRGFRRYTKCISGL